MLFEWMDISISGNLSRIVIIDDTIPKVVTFSMKSTNKLVMIMRKKKIFQHGEYYQHYYHKRNYGVMINDSEQSNEHHLLLVCWLVVRSIYYLLSFNMFMAIPKGIIHKAASLQYTYTHTQIPEVLAGRSSACVCLYMCVSLYTCVCARTPNVLNRRRRLMFVENWICVDNDDRIDWLYVDGNAMLAIFFTHTLIVHSTHTHRRDEWGVCWFSMYEHVRISGCVCVCVISIELSWGFWKRRRHLR